MHMDYRLFKFVISYDFIIIESDVLDNFLFEIIEELQKKKKIQFENVVTIYLYL